METSDYISIAALIFSIFSFGMSLWERSRTKKRDEELRNIAKEEAARTALIQALQGEKESIGFTASRLMKDGLPADKSYREQILLALVQAAIFSGSDRARAMVYSVLRDNYGSHRVEIDKMVALNEDRFKQFEQFQLNKEELDLERGTRRLKALKKILTG